MAHYVIGDVQGCYDPLRRLLDKIQFDPASDHAWFTGDLVNRGPQSANVLRLVAGLGVGAESVLGNHDLHLLAVAANSASVLSSDTFQDVLSADDRDQLLNWLRHRPLLCHDPKSKWTLVHAGLLPQWDLAQAMKCAKEAELYITGRESTELFAHMYGDEPSEWNDGLTGWDRVRLIVNVFTRLRFCYPNGRANYRHKGPPGTQPAPLVPWFQVPGRRTGSDRIVCGHWAMLGRYDNEGVVCVDTGCAWGRELTAVRLDADPRQFISVKCETC